LIVCQNYARMVSPYHYGDRSKEHLRLLCPELQDIARAAIYYMNLSITGSIRTSAEHDLLLVAGKTKVPFSKTLHSFRPSKAMHLEPFPINHSARPKNKARYYYMAGIVQMLAKQFKFRARWGGDWDSDHIFIDQYFDDLAHFEFRGWM